MGDKANVLVGVAEITLGVGVAASVIGYTVDGVTMTVRPEFANVHVDELVGTNIRILTDLEVEATLNMAEGTLANLAAAIPGSDLTVPTLTLGGGDLQEHRLTLRGVTPAGRDRVIVLTKVNPTGEVSTPYKKGEMSVVPVKFSALVGDDSEFGEVVDAQAAPPTLSGAETDGAGTQIEATFDKAMANPAGKHLEFWWTRDGAAEAFTGASVLGDVITLTIDPLTPILNPDVILLYYVLGTIRSTDIGILASFADEPVINNVP